MRDEIERYRRCDVRPFGVNPASAERHAGYAARLKLPFPLLSDAGLGISRSYGAVRPDASAIAKISIALGARGSVHTESFEMLEVEELLNILAE